MIRAEWTDDDSDRGAEARAREVATVSPSECRGLLRRLAGWMSLDADRRDVWANEHWAITTH